MLAISENALLPGQNHHLTPDTDDPTLWLLPERQRSEGDNWSEASSPPVGAT